MNIVVLLIILLLLFGGGGFYVGGPMVGGSLGGLILLVSGERRCDGVGHRLHVTGNPHQNVVSSAVRTNTKTKNKDDR